MPNIPVRKLGAFGIIKDVNPFDLPVNAFSDGINVRFDNDKLQRASIFRTFFSGLTGSVPVYCHSGSPPGGFDFVLYANNDGRIFMVANSSETEVTRPSFSPGTDPRPFTSTTLAEIIYFNRPDNVPSGMGPNDTQFGLLPGWDSTWRCNSLRSFKDYLFAINVTKGASVFTNMVKWSTNAKNNTMPQSWDDTSTTNQAGENQLTQLKTPLIDGGPLGENFILYSKDEAWLVEFTGGELIFNWRRLPFDNSGIINQNCSIEIDGYHYVWGPTDIYIHDGVEKKSIIDQRNRIKFFKELNISKSNVFFIQHDRGAHEVLFCGVSGSANAAFPTPNGYCNYAAVYNYVKDTWSFIDLPNVSFGTLANTNTVLTYADAPATITYTSVGGSYFDQEDSFTRFPVFTSVTDPANGLVGSKLHVLDNADVGKIALPIDLATVKPAWAQRTGLSLDIEGAPLRAYKNVRAVMPLIEVFAPGATVETRFGAHLTAGGPVMWAPEQTFDPVAAYKLDLSGGGRFLAYTFTMPTANDFEASGFDVDAVITGKR